MYEYLNEYVIIFRTTNGTYSLGGMVTMLVRLLNTVTVGLDGVITGGVVLLLDHFELFKFRK